MPETIVKRTYARRTQPDPASEAPVVAKQRCGFAPIGHHSNEMHPGYNCGNPTQAWALALSLTWFHALVATTPAAHRPQGTPTRTAALLPVELKCEYLSNPLGMDATAPHLSWQIESSQNDQTQSAYQILVASSRDVLDAGKGDLWDSGKITSSSSVHIQYGGSAMTSRQLAYWKVRVWDHSKRPSDWSKPALWEMGLLKPSDWLAEWIGSGPEKEPRPQSGFFKSTNELAQVNQRVVVDGRSTLLRKEFILEHKAIARARAYVTGLGYYELSCNGRRVGDYVLAPAKSNYRKWVLYDTYDVASHLQPGTNALGMILGNGWFNPYQKWWEPYRMQWFGSKRALLQLHIDYADGSSQVIVSDQSWKTTPGPVLQACVYDGETYDATQETPTWNEPSTDDTAWKPAHRVESPGGSLRSPAMPPIKVVDRLTPRFLASSKHGVYVFDFGQNFAGWVQLRVAGPKGARIQLRYAEDRLPDGNVDVTSNERALATDVYITKGGGMEVYEPRFTFHGFRYVELTGFPGVPQKTNLVGCVVHTDSSPTGSFYCGSDLINRIHHATVWSQRSNLMGYPMDCPQRDERLGWFGDAMVSMQEAMLNFDMPAFYRQWLDGVQLNQNPANGDISIVSPRPYMTDEPDPTWSSGYIIMVWHYYLQYGDRDFLSRHFASMQRYVDYLATQARNSILPKYWIGDWGTTVPGWKEGEPVSVATAFYYYDTVLLAKTARVLGKDHEAFTYNAAARHIRAEFNRAFYHGKTHSYDSDTQFSNALPLFLGLVEKSEEAAVLQNIVADIQRHEGHFDVGVLGAKYLIEALTDFGRADIAYELVNQPGFPGWAHMLDAGQTTLSEFWDLRGSHNHVMMGSIDAWFYRTLAGIQFDENQPGFQHTIIKPFIPETLDFVQAKIQTVRGPIEVSWQKLRENLRLRVSIPANTTATVHVPAPSATAIVVVPRMKLAGFDQHTSFFNIGSGTYEFQVSLSK